MKTIFEQEWRTQSRAKRKFYAKYMGWLERGGYFVVLCVFGAFIFAFNYQVDDIVKAENVTIEAQATTVSLESDCMVIRPLVENFSSVKMGQPILVVAEGLEDITKVQQSQLAELITKSGKPLPSALNPLPPAGKTILSPTDGVLRITETSAVIPKGEAVATILDYDTLVLNAELEGATVGKAAVDQRARISAINMSDGGTILFRGEAGAEDVLSDSLVGTEVQTELERQLKGAVVKVRDDIPVKVESVKLLQIDSKVALAASSANLGTVQSAPSSKYTLEGRVTTGEHVGVVQLALPSTFSEGSLEAVQRAAQARNLKFTNGQSKTISRLEDTKFVVQLNVRGSAGAASESMPVTAINRKFAARVTLDSPPEFLINAVKAADRNGHKVTARVEVVTGTRPIAKLLLKKS